MAAQIAWFSHIAVGGGKDPSIQNSTPQRINEWDSYFVLSIRLSRKRAYWCAIVFRSGEFW